MYIASKKIDITPKKPVPMAGYSLRKGKSRGILSPLYARIVYLEDNIPVVIVSLDIIRVDNDLYREISKEVSKTLGLPQKNVFVSATHTHSGPEISTSFWNTTELSEEDIKLVMEYRSFLIEQIKNLVEEIQPKLGRLYGGRTEIDMIASNRINPKGPVDKECVFLVSEKDIIILNFACHPTVLPAENMKFSGDLAGAITEFFESHFRTAIFLNGAAGNISTRFTRKEQNLQETLRLANLFYEQVMHSFENVSPVSGEINVEWKNLKLRLRDFPSLEAIEKLEQEAFRMWKKSLNATPPVRRMSESNYLGVKILKHRLSLLKGMKEINFRIAKMSIGKDFVMIFVPAELFVEYQIAMKRASTYRYTMLVGYSNGYWGYVPYNKTEENIYERAVSLIHPEEYKTILRALLDFVQ